MTIRFYLDDEKETEITSFYELTSNPFKVGDRIWLSVDDVCPADYNKYTGTTQTDIIKKNQIEKSTFNRKMVEIVRECKDIRFVMTTEPILTIEYHCIIVNPKD